MDASSPRLLLDQGVSRDAAAHLRDRGYQCIHVAEVGMSQASDADIISWALSHGSIAITLDADFHTILAVSGAALPSVIRIRMEGLKGLAVADIVQKVIEGLMNDLLSGALVTVKANKITCHRLPIGRPV